MRSPVEQVQTDQSPLVEKWFAQVSSIRNVRQYECDVKRDIKSAMRSEGESVDMIAAAHVPDLGIHSGPKLMLLELRECVSVLLESGIHFTLSV